MRTFKRIGAKGALVLVTELPRAKKSDPQYHAQLTTRMAHGWEYVWGLGNGDTIEEAVDAACGL